jgi:Flp pilus assembly protein TadB
MLDPPLAIGAVAAGALCASAVLLVGREPAFIGAGQRTSGFRASAGAVRQLEAARRRLAHDIELAGWRETPSRVATAATALSLCFGFLGAAISPAVAVVAFIGGGVTCVLVLNAAIDKRRRRFSGELVPLLELFTLELSAGGSALAALGSVCVQVESELAIDLRRMLIASQVAGTASFEARLIEYAEVHEIAALSSLATILAASRDYGTAASQGIRALATDLRRAQRRELIAQSRRALNNVLLPAALAVLLPFLGVLMFPAVSVLQRSLR